MMLAGRTIDFDVTDNRFDVTNKRFDATAKLSPEGCLGLGHADRVVERGADRCYRRCVLLKETMLEYQASGGKRSDHYKKHDTARAVLGEDRAARAQAQRAAVLRAGLRDAGVDLRA